MTEKSAPKKVDVWPVGRIKPSPLNTKFHPPGQVEKLADSMREFGWTAPLIVAKDGELLAGHGRLQAASQLGLEKVPVVVVDALDENERRAYRIADNRIPELGRWDSQILSGEVSDLLGAEFDLSLMGFSDLQLAKMVESDSGIEGEDDAPDLREDAVAQTGDVWLMDDHRLACGDCTDEATVALACGKHQPILMVTDPPYGVNYRPVWRKETGLLKSGSMGVVDNDDIADWRHAYQHFKGAVAYVWHASLHHHTVAQSLEACGFRIESQIVWRKNRFAVGRGNYHPAHENLVYCVQPRRKSKWNSGVAQGTVWRISNAGQDDTDHSTQKPVECMRRPIRHSSLPGDAVYEPFMGSGSTLIACEFTDRICVGLELNPLYVDMAVRRWQDRTGREAIHEASGETFARREKAMAEARKPSPKRKGRRSGKASR